MSNRRTRRPYTDARQRASMPLRHHTQQRASMPLHHHAALISCLLLAACNQAQPGATAGAAGHAAESSSGPSSLSRPQIVVTPQASSSPNGPVLGDPNDIALQELLAKAPSAQPPTTGPEAGTLVGTDTEVAGKVSPILATTPTHMPELTAGTPVLDPPLSSPVIEREARAQIYWALHKACPGPDDKPLPPEVITLVFTIRPDGNIEPASVQASASDPRYTAVAECVLRTFSSLPFHGPLAGREATTPVVVTWPSVD